MDKKIAVVAVGGNSLIKDKAHNSIPNQYEAVTETVRHLADMIEQGWDVVITHGNGPQVGFILRRSELSIPDVNPVPMDYAGADTQGAIGYMFQKALLNEFFIRGISRNVATLVTQVLVDRSDPAFDNPTKPIGSFMDEDTAQLRAAEYGWIVKEDAGRGWRRVVPSPEPKIIMELNAIQSLNKAGFVVIACGGGGIPIIKDENGKIFGVEAVIDKDFASSLLAQNLDADLLLISTGVEKVAINFNQPDEIRLSHLSLQDAYKYINEGHFAAGSMLPKIKAVLNYLEHGGKKGLITNPQNIGNALNGSAGTVFTSTVNNHS